MANSTAPLWPYAPRETVSENQPAVIAEGLTLHATPQAPSLIAPAAFSIQRQQHTALIGPNGSGKSTLLRTIAGLLPVTTGSLKVLGQAPRRGRSSIAYLSQSFQLTPNFPISVEAFVATGTYSTLGWFRRPTPSHPDVAAALAQLGLQSLAQHRLETLSGGQLQRARLARAFAQKAELLLLDEPFAGLDQESRELIEHFLFHEPHTLTILMATHDSCDFGHCPQTLSLRHGQLEIHHA